MSPRLLWHGDAMKLLTLLRCTNKRSVRSRAAIRLLESSNLLAHALHAAGRAKGKNTAGPDGVKFDALTLEERDALLAELKEELASGKYMPGPVRRWSKTTGAKSRTITTFNLRDRVVHHAVRLLLEATFGSFPESIYSRPGRGHHQAVEYAARALELVPEDSHVLHSDVADCFDTIDLGALKRRLLRLFEGGKFMRIVVPVLHQGQHKRGRGLAQGSPLSPLLADLYLVSVDHFLECRGNLIHVRYMDDLLVVVPGGRERALAVEVEIAQKLSDQGQRLNERKTTITTPQQAVNFLGASLRRTSAETTTTPTEGKKTSPNAELSVDGSEQAMATSVAQFTETSSNREPVAGIPDAGQANGLHTQPVKSPSNSTNFPKPYPSLTNNNNGGRLYRTTGYGGSPSRAEAAQLGSSVGDQVYSYGSELLCPNDKFSSSKIGSVSDKDLGIVRHRFSEAHDFWGEALHVAQQEIQSARTRRKEMREKRAHLPKAEADRRLAKLATHQKVIQAQQAARATARIANQELAIFQALIDAIDAEMTKRTRALGLVAAPGRVHQAQVRASRFRYPSMNLKRPGFLAAPGLSFPRWKVRS